MAIIVTNQKPAVLEPVHTSTCKGDFDPMAAFKKTIVDPILMPLTPGTDAAIVDGSGNDLVHGLEDVLGSCLGDERNSSSEEVARDLMEQCLVHYSSGSTLPFRELFVNQAAGQAKLPLPTTVRPGVLYSTAGDIVPAAKTLLLGNDDGQPLFVSLAMVHQPATLGFWFRTQGDFTIFTDWLDQQLPLLQALVPVDTYDKLKQVVALELKGLTESLLLRKDDADGNEENSFARTLINLLMAYHQQLSNSAASNTGSPAMGVMPFDLGELFCPRSIVLINVEVHARATPARIDAEWSIINQSIASPIKIISHKKLSKLTTLPRFAQRTTAAAAMRRKQGSSRSAKVVFRKQPPSKLDLMASLHRALMRMGKVNKSQNIFRSTRSTFIKANRRDPDDYNKAGRITSINYMPDLHIYLDTSGSISEENYQEAVMMLIKIAKKLNVNLYLNSFSHILSQETLLRTSGKSSMQIWKEFRKVPKVTGGTDFAQIWQYIHAKPARQRRLSLLITDFAWTPPAGRVEHPKNLYYAPCSAMDWTAICTTADRYAKNMQHIEPAIRSRMLGLFV